MRRNGFTLIELLIVVAILAIVFSIVAANCGGRNKQQTDNWDPYKYAPAQEQTQTR